MFEYIVVLFLRIEFVVGGKILNEYHAFHFGWKKKKNRIVISSIKISTSVIRLQLRITKGHLVSPFYDFSTRTNFVSFISYGTLEFSSNLRALNPDLTEVYVSLMGSCYGLLCLRASKNVIMWWTQPPKRARKLLSLFGDYLVCDWSIY